MLVATVNQSAVRALLNLPQVLLCAQEAGIGGLLRGLCGKRGWKSRHDCSVSSHLDDKLVFPLPTAAKSVEISLIGRQTSDGEYFAEKKTPRMLEMQGFRRRREESSFPSLNGHSVSDLDSRLRIEDFFFSAEDGVTHRTSSLFMRASMPIAISSRLCP